MPPWFRLRFFPNFDMPRTRPCVRRSFFHETGRAVRAWGENPYPCAPAPRISCSRLRAPSAGKQAARRGAPVVAGRTSRNGTVSLAAQDADHSMITRDLGVRDRTGRVQHSADNGLHDNDVGLPSLMNIHLPACVRNASTARTHILLQW